MDHLTLGVFSPSVLLDVATTTGRLAAAGLTVTDVAGPSSPLPDLEIFGPKGPKLQNGDFTIKNNGDFRK